MTQVIGTEAVVASLARKSAAIRERIVKAQKANGIGLAGYVVSQKLSGQVLKVRTNRLRGSINDQLRETSSEITTAVGTNVVYARPHEMGFHDTVSVREHLRTITTAFGRPINPRQVLVRSHPMKMNIPEKSFLRSSLAEQRSAMLDRLRAAMGEGARS